MTYILVTLTCRKQRKHNIKYVVMVLMSHHSSCPAQGCLIKKHLLSEAIILVIIRPNFDSSFSKHDILVTIKFWNGGTQFSDGGHVTPVVTPLIVLSGEGCTVVLYNHFALSTNWIVPIMQFTDQSYSFPCKFSVLPGFTNQFTEKWRVVTPHTHRHTPHGTFL